MEGAAEYWGKPHNEVLFKLCVELVKQKMGEDCATIVQNLSTPCEQIEQLIQISQLSDIEFRNAFSELCHEQLFLHRIHRCLGKGIPGVRSCTPLPEYILQIQNHSHHLKHREILQML